MISESETYHYSIFDAASGRQYYFFAYQVATWSDQYDAEIMFESGAINTDYHFINLHVFRENPNEVIIDEPVEPEIVIDTSIIVDYTALSEVANVLRESSHLIEFDLGEIGDNNNVFDISAAEGEEVGVMFFVSNNEYRRVDISVPSG